MYKGAKSWKILEGAVSLESPLLVGILNVTPDSFSDGGQYDSVSKAVAQAKCLFEQGARIVDVGGESTRPGAQSVSPSEQINRVVPVIKGMADLLDGIISIDTTSVEVASAAIDAGASIINDVSAGTDDPAMFDLAAKSGVGLVLMHRLVPPHKDKYSDQYETLPHYKDVVTDVLHWLLARVELALTCSVASETIAIDPGLGFGKSLEQNMELVNSMGAFVESGYPVFVGASRKSFVGSISEISEPADRDDASAELAVSMQKRGVQVFRVHDVRTHVRMLQFPVQHTNTNDRR